MPLKDNEPHTQPEGEPEPHGFHITIDDPQKLLEALQKGISGDIGRHLLESPLEEVGIEALSKKETFNFVATVKADFDFRHKHLKRYRQIVKEFAMQYQDFKERGGNYLITASRGTPFVIYSETALDWYYISTGFIKESFKEDLQLFPAPTTTEESMETVFADLKEVIEDFVSSIYRSNEQTPPDEKMIIHPPSQKMNGRGLADLLSPGQTPEELLGKLEIEKPDTKFDDIGGQQEAKKEIEGLAFALKNPELYQQWGTRPPKGIILFGPPGTGKTLMAKALASQAEAKFFHVEASDISSKWYGESEKIVKQIFELAGRDEIKTIIFFDEIDAIAPQRENAHEATQRTISALLENMDGLTSNKNIMIVASTNRLDSIEPALLRAGRFDRWVEVPLPDEEGRAQIFGIHMAKADAVAGRELFTNVNLKEIIPKTDKLSGADIAELIRRTLEEKVRQAGKGESPQLVSAEDLIKELAQYEKIRKTKKQIGFIPNGE